MCVVTFYVFFTTTVSESVAGGSSDTIKNAPYLVSLNTGKFRQRHFCGGVIIALSWILTAGHCMRNVGLDDFIVRAGSSYRNQGGQIRSVSRVVVHEYNNLFIRNDFDFALLELESPLAPEDTTYPVPLTDRNDHHAPEDICFVAGWGRSESSRGSVKPYPYAKCQKFFITAQITEAKICAGGSEINACNGDSGGPLVCNLKLTGIVSWGRGNTCGSPYSPYVVYGNVARARNWISVHSGV
ncbi:trypsin-2-like [Toxorhynchites rutilus septentrionalis]|uniref:trypsin-2-like n=1 Tax=Toxorhynchites rutilus septentrionalis TaxID=329112 RepID=UPI002479E7CD|nr:trypsin-2-like [Toxorhynchites rutilus septentrionalis]